MPGMKKIATVYQIKNGYIVCDEADESLTYISEFAVDQLRIDHVKKMEDLVLSLVNDRSSKIPAIRLVRKYANDHALYDYVGLKDSKDFVEKVRPNWISDL